MLHRRLFALGTLALTLLCVACSGSSSLTLDEYAEWCSRDTAESLGIDTEELAGSTWGEVAEVFAQLVDEAQAIEPPEELERYHSGQVQVAQAVLAFAQGQEDDELFNVFSLIGVGLVVSGIVEEAEASLTDQAREVLRAAGCLDSEEEAVDQVDRADPALIGDRIAVHRTQSDDRFDLVVLGQPQYDSGYYRLPVRVFAIEDEWEYDTSIWSNEQLELVSQPDSTGRIYKITDNILFGDPPEDSLFEVILVAGGTHTGSLYFSADDVPAGTVFVELRYPATSGTKVVDLTK